jgi:hypothetical protein
MHNCAKLCMASAQVAVHLFGLAQRARDAARAVPRDVTEALCAWDHRETYPLGPPPPPDAAAGFSRTFDLGASHHPAAQDPCKHTLCTDLSRHQRHRGCAQDATVAKSLLRDNWMLLLGSANSGHPAACWE